MEDIYLITNHKGAFGNKYKTSPYHSGMDKLKLTGFFKENGYKVIFISPSEIDLRDKKYINAIVLYTTTEDNKEYYDVNEGEIFFMRRNCLHNFICEDEDVVVFVWSPDSGTGPTDEVNPLKIRTYVGQQRYHK